MRTSTKKKKVDLTEEGEKKYIEYLIKQSEMKM